MSQLRLRESATDPFEAAFRRFFSPALADTGTPLMSMRLDVTESAAAYQVQAELPGVRKEDIQVRVDGNVVQIDAESRSEREQQDPAKAKGERVLRTERYYGTISRTFSLASDIDDGKVEARYADGVLQLTLPKKAPQEGRKITVQ
ncbi:Hsp20/alpha crystallin family protein [Ramlibacter rhizophilus]|uniref:Hsp20/alpha crystallin family protein n=1 Tax=Ramlibacter rhizophilus TaxID=1781167 RepID=A0A4Z0BL05_9BURK|nr:Hsp20/alpha crystallin family protein [Ramlibacter rhizophilus]TFY98588.1 Hsp20/alpha crystallin family protein [Ramlibacter rhizophilus]